MPLPRSVEAAAARAEELQKKVYQPEGQQQQDPNAAPVETTAPKAEPTQAETPAPESKPAEPDYKHKFETLTGKYNAEVPRLAAQLREAVQEIARLRAEVEVAKTKPLESLLKPEEIQEFGEPLIDVTRRVAQEVTRGHKAELDEVKRELERRRVEDTKTAEIRFFESLASAVPDWSVLNDDERFHAWLREADPFAGRTRQALLEDAEAARDASRVATFFKAFKDSTSHQAATAKTKLEEQIAPPQGSPTNAPPAKRIWTRREIGQFYADWRGGKVPSDRAVAIEAEIQFATLEGRVR